MSVFNDALEYLNKIYKVIIDKEFDEKYSIF